MDKEKIKTWLDSEEKILLDLISDSTTANQTSFLKGRLNMIKSIKNALEFGLFD